MAAVTYPDAKVISFVSENMVPIQVLFDAKPLSVDFNVKWTPTLITLDTEGKEHHRTVGFLSPDELIPSLSVRMHDLVLIHRSPQAGNDERRERQGLSSPGLVFPDDLASFRHVHLR